MPKVDEPVEVKESFDYLYMSKEELLAMHKQLCNKAAQLMDAKNSDYSGEQSESRFNNFTNCENLNICTTEQGMFVRLTDKLSRLVHIEKQGKSFVKDESVLDTVLDVINYIILYYAYRTEKENNAKNNRKPNG